jgi:CrcB protein
MSVLVWLAVAVSGGLGAIARFLVNERFQRGPGSRLPVGTFVINISGAFLLGLLTGLALTGDALVIAGTATIGSYTTFSTWMLETQRLEEDENRASAAINVAASLLVGLGAAALGRLIGTHV